MPRLPRFRRSKFVPLLRLTDRDRAIINLVHEHRFLRSWHLRSLLPGSPQQLLRRLQLLYHHGYLERPRTQLEYFHERGSEDIVYGLGNKARKFVKGRYVGESEEISWGEKNRAVKKVFLQHALLVSNVMVAFTLACRERKLRLLTEHDLIRELPERKRFRWNVRLPEGPRLAVVPDRVFAIDVPDPDDASNRAYFFLEADRGTMPVVRKNLAQTSFRRKLLAYEATWAQEIHRKRFGFHRFRVLTVTVSAARVKSLLNACSNLERGRGMFLFADRSILTKPGCVLDMVWQCAIDQKMRTPWN